MKRTILVASALLLSLGGVMAQQDQLKVIVNFPKLLPQSLFRPFYEAASIPSYHS